MLTITIVAILFGIFPLWWWAAGDIMHAVVFEHKKVPKLMLSLAQGNPITIFIYLFLYQKSYYRNILRALAIIWVLWLIFLSHWNDWYYNSIGQIDSTWLYIIEAEICFVLPLLLTWILPNFFLNRYLSNLPQNNDEKYPAL